MRYNLLEALMGAVVLVIAALFLVFAYTSSQTEGRGGYHLKAAFDRIDGLSIGSDVKLSGVKIGTITQIDVDENYQILATFSVKQDIKIPLDSSAEIVSENFLGGKYLAIVPGGNQDYLEPDETVAYTQSSVSFESLLSKFLFSSKGDDHEKKTEPVPPAPTAPLAPPEKLQQQATGNGKAREQPAALTPPIKNVEEHELFKRTLQFFKPLD